LIAYTDQNGKIIGGCYADSPDSLNGITHLPADATEAVYVDDVQYPNVWTDMGEYIITNGVPVFTPIPDATKLANAQQAKSTQLQMSLLATLAGGFNSSATGTSYLYGFADMDQTNLGQELNMVNAGLAVEPIAWAVRSGQVIDHTIAQFKQMCADGNRFKWNNVNQLRTLIGQVESATTVDAVNAIVWSPATY
jgi:hypothetical protein